MSKVGLIWKVIAVALFILNFIFSLIWKDVAQDYSVLYYIPLIQSWINSAGYCIIIFSIGILFDRTSGADERISLLYKYRNGEKDNKTLLEKGIWICGKCRSRNNAGVIVCGDCGEYK